MASFDDAAITYDSEFSHSAIGSRLRKLVWNILPDEFEHKKLNILEINCGTGEDAIHFAEAGHSVIATDASANMLQMAVGKSNGNNPQYKVVSYAELSSVFNKSTFDVVFSNFGGLNCVDKSELQTTLGSINDLLKPGGLFIGVIMGTRCIWELLYYGTRFKFKSATRRLTSKGVDCTIGSHTFKVYYHSPSKVKMLVPKQLQLIRLAPVGFFIPPSYTEHFFVKHMRQLDTLLGWEKSVYRFSSLANFADHYMITFRKVQ